MKHTLLALGIAISSGTIPIDSTTAYWAVFGPLDVSTMAVAASTATAPVILKSDTTNDCYVLKTNPNGSLYTVWTPCK